MVAATGGLPQTMTRKGMYMYTFMPPLTHLFSLRDGLPLMSQGSKTKEGMK